MDISRVENGFQRFHHLLNLMACIPLERNRAFSQQTPFVLILETFEGIFHKRTLTGHASQAVGHKGMQD